MSGKKVKKSDQALKKFAQNEEKLLKIYAEKEKVSDEIFKKMLSEKNEMLIGSGGQKLVGTDSHNKLMGTKSNDFLSGRLGNDTLEGDLGNDRLEGGLGNDVLCGGLGNDRLDGGFGDDIYTYNKGDGHDVIKDIFGRNTLILKGLKTTDIASIKVNNHEHSGTIYFKDGGSVKGVSVNQRTIEFFIFDDKKLDLFDVLLKAKGTEQTEGKDILKGMAGDMDDTLISGGGDDMIFGYLGDDDLFGGRGNDILDGGVGNDIYIYNKGDGNDIIKDSDGNDILVLSGIKSTDIKEVEIDDDSDKAVIELKDGTKITSTDIDQGTIETFIFDNTVMTQEDIIALE